MPDALVDRLLEAQVAFHLERLTGPDAPVVVAGMVEAFLDGVGSTPLVDLVDVDEVKDVVARAMTSSADGPVVRAVVDVVREVLRAGPSVPFPLSDVVERSQVEDVVDAALALTPALEKALDRLSASPMVGTMATRFLARVMSEALQANQAVAEKVPGIGGLLSLGASLASSVATGAIGAADKQLDGLLGDTVGRGGSFAVGRLNAIVLDTLRDPTTREAVLQVWDLIAAEPLRGLGDRASADEVAEVADAVQQLVTSTLAHPHAVSFAHSVVDALAEGYGRHTATELLSELGVDRADVIAGAARRAPAVLEVLVESGVIESWLRSELAVFYSSDAVTGLLATD